jgi:glycosyltransferase involved in cell wall biosynthesis
VNILFVNYGDFTANSLNHIGPFAAQLQSLGHSCVVAVPAAPETLSAIPSPHFIPAVFTDLLKQPSCFPDGRAADIVHAWTPRENVRSFVLEYVRLTKARVVVHLEDNEEHLTAMHLGFGIEAMKSEDGLRKAEAASDALSHPLRHRFFLRAADAITVIVPSLRDFVPPGVPCVDLPPGIDFSLYKPAPPDPALRARLGLRNEEKVVVFTGSNTFANEREVRELYRAVALLNERGTATRLVRTGLFSKEFRKPLPQEWLARVLDLGFIDKALLPQLLALSDVVVQPGRPGPFNDYRLPSKIPEMLAMGLPAVLPAANAGRELRDGVDALLLKKGDAPEIADACERIFRDPALGRRLGEGAAAFARTHYDLTKITSGLDALYRRVLAKKAAPSSLSALASCESDAGLYLRNLAYRLPDAWDSEAVEQLAPYLSVLEEQQQAIRELAHLKETHAATLLELGDVRRHADNLERTAQERQRLTDQHVANLEGFIAARQKRIEELDAQCAHLEKTLHALQSEYASEVARLGEIVQHREARIAAMQATLTWRLSTPFRWLGSKLGL